MLTFSFLPPPSSQEKNAFTHLDLFDKTFRKVLHFATKLFYIDSCPTTKNKRHTNKSLYNRASVTFNAHRKKSNSMTRYRGLMEFRDVRLQTEFDLGKVGWRRETRGERKIIREVK